MLMRFRLRTLMIVLGFVAVVAAIVRENRAWGLFAYAVGLSLFVLAYRIRNLIPAKNKVAMNLWVKPI
jgi:hypothetical protein